MPSAVLELAILAAERPQTFVVVRNGRPYRRVTHYRYVKLVCLGLSGVIWQNVITVRYQRQTCLLVSQTPAVAASVIP
jgi:hypothetical protein